MSRTQPQLEGTVRSAVEPSFQQALDQAAAIATLSPSSHNCQPWGHAWLKSERAVGWARELLQGCGDIASPDGIYLALAKDTDRSLGALPSHAAEMLLSCGSYWQHLLRALAAQGWTPSAVHHLDPEAADQAGYQATHPTTACADWPPGWRMLSLAVLHRGDVPPSTGLATFRSTAAARHTNRAPYRDLAVAPETLHDLAHLSPTTWDPSTPTAMTRPTAGAPTSPVIVRHLRSPTDLRRFATLIAHRAGRDFSDNAAWRETHSYFRWTSEEAETRRDGFTPRQIFGPTSAPRELLARAALNPAVLPRLCRLGFDRYLGAQLAKTARATPVIAAAGLSTDTPTTTDYLTAGMWLADYWLTATRAGLALHPLSILTQHEDLRTELQQRFGLPGRTFFVARLGHPTAAAAATLRRPASALAL